MDVALSYIILDIVWSMVTKVVFAVDGDVDGDVACIGFLHIMISYYTIILYRVIFFTGTPLKSMEKLG